MTSPAKRWRSNECRLRGGALLYLRDMLEQLEGEDEPIFSSLVILKVITHLNTLL